MNNTSDFIIGNGVLTRYTGPGGDVVIPDGVTRIGNRAFYECRNLTSITIPDSVTTIGDGVFWECSSLMSVDIPDSVTIIGYSAFSGCSNLTSVTILGSVTTIGKEAFRGCRNLTSVTIPDSVTIIGNRVFYECRNLTSITIPDSVTTIGKEVFWGCRNLTSVTIPDSVTIIGNRVFYECRNLTSITIPDSVTTIGKEAFRGCRNLTSITIPDNVTTIGFGAFCDCENLTVYWAGSGNVGAEAFNGIHCAVLPRVPFAQFDAASTRRAAILGFLQNTDRYTDEAIRTAYCKYAIRQRKQLLTHIFAEDQVLALLFYAEQQKITAANFETEYMTPASAANATECVAFLLDWSRTHISQEDVDQQLERELLKDPFNAADMKKLWSYGPLDDGTLMLTSYKGDAQEVFVPERIGKKSVTMLGDHVFSTSTASGADKPAPRRAALEQIHSVMIPDSILHIGEGAFSGCTGLTEITIPDRVTILSENLFRGCTGLTNVTLPQTLKKIRANAFKDCTALTDIALPGTITSIGRNVFKGCANLVIHGPAGRKAAAYAEKHQIPFVAE